MTATVYEDILLIALCFHQAVAERLYTPYSKDAQKEKSLSFSDKGRERRRIHGKRLSGALSPSLNNPMILIIHISPTEQNEQRAAGCNRL